MHLATNSAHVNIDSDMPEIFTERLMQVQLARFWRSSGSGRNSGYDPTQAEQKYEKFCEEYLPSLPPAFALKPDTKWDTYLPKLAMQRQLLHICVFDSICWNFRPLLLLKPSQVASLAPYKQVLLQSQKKVLAIAALSELEAIAALHSLFNGCHTRFGAIIFNTFEASVLLLSLCAQTDFQIDEEDNSGHLLGLKVGRLTRKRLVQAVEKGLGRLQMLAEVSDMAAAGARTLARLFTNVSTDVEYVSPVTSDRSSWNTPTSDLLGVNCDLGYPAPLEHPNLSLLAEPLSMMASEESFSSMQLSNSALLPPLGFE